MREKLPALVCLFVLVCAFVSGADDFHIGIITGTSAQAEDDLRGAEALIAEYGKANEGGMIQHLTYPVNFMDEQETTISIIAGLADDPLMKAVVVNQGIPGTSEGFRRIKERRPDIICLTGEPQEEPAIIASVADLVINTDFVSRGYLIVRTAHELGCDTFVHISFPRHLSSETIERRAAVMKEACEEFGLKFVMETAPDPMSDAGVAGAQQYILEKTPEWVEKYGQQVAFFCSNNSHIEPLIRSLAECGGYFIEAPLPSPIMGYPGALGIDLKEEAGNFPAILSKVEECVVEKGGEGRFGTWAYSYGFSTSAGLGQHAINVVRGEAELLSISDILSAYNKYSPDVSWGSSYYADADTGVMRRNMYLLYQDTYIMGRGYMGNTGVEVPDEYWSFK